MLPLETRDVTATQMRSRLSFARVCVEVDYTAQMPSAIPFTIEDFGTIEVKIEYPWRPIICTLCRQYGHSDQNCKIFKKEWRPAAANVPLQKKNEQSASNKDPYVSQAESSNVPEGDKAADADTSTSKSKEPSHVLTEEKTTGVDA